MLHKINTQKTKARFSCLLRHPVWKRSATILIEWEGIKTNKIDEANKGKREK